MASSRLAEVGVLRGFVKVHFGTLAGLETARSPVVPALIS